jgi:UPF0271 protein
VLDDPVEVTRRALRIAVDHQVTAIGGTIIDLVASSICVHGDTPRAAGMATRVRFALEGLGVTLRPFVS